MEERIILSLSHISKTYPGVIALNDVSINFREGEIHALLGENGAGKSTLIKTISGAIVPDKGSICIDGNTYKHMTPILAKQLGIEVMYQEFNLVEALTVSENIYLGEREQGLFSKKNLEERAAALIKDLGIALDPDAEVESLSPGKKQLVEICKCVSRHVKILILDEPTAPLSSSETEVLFKIIKNLKEQGITIIYISHRMEEIFTLADRVSIFRDGRYIKTLSIQETNRKELVKLMVGRELKESFPRRTTIPGEILLELDGLTGNGCKNISFSVRRGEIYGLAGLVGAGRTEIMQVVFGAAKREAGQIKIAGKPVEINSPAKAISLGMGLIPEDRKFLGCLQEHSIQFNISLASLRNICRWFVINVKKEQSLAAKFKQVLNIKAATISQEVQTLSGGNQQKVVLAKTLAASPEILIFDEPTRGIDVGAKQEIYELMNELAAEGKAIVMISSDQEELLGMSDRIGVICEGTFIGELQREEFDQELIVAMASGISKEEYKCHI